MTNQSHEPGSTDPSSATCLELRKLGGLAHLLRKVASDNLEEHYRDISNGIHSLAIVIEETVSKVHDLHDLEGLARRQAAKAQAEGGAA